MSRKKKKVDDNAMKDECNGMITCGMGKEE
jgi:hypothetical protein